jgi:hypothetical protein
VIVDENDCRRPLGDRFPKHFTRMHERRIEQAAGYRDVALEPVLGVEDGYVKLFDRKILQTLSKDLEDIARPAHRRSFLSLFGRHAPPQLQGRMDANRTSCSYTPDAGKGRHRLRRQQSQRPPAGGKYLLANSERGSAFGSATNKDSQ